LIQHHFGRNRADSLYSAAIRYKSDGFCAIPVRGETDPTQPKLPAIRWSRYQHERPSTATLRDWFITKGYAGLAVVCGQVSRLVVIDFDAADLASEFRRTFPHLTKTYVVSSGTRKLPHFYFRLPEGVSVPTRAYPGVDVRGEGSYVVAPPTIVAEAAWEVLQDQPYLTLSQRQIDQVLAWLDSLTGAAKPTVIEVPQVPLTAPASEFRRTPVSPEGLAAIYRASAPYGRNNALFKAAQAGRDAGMTRTHVIVCLAALHARQPGARPEHFDTRYAEALKTIESVFTRPPRRNSDAPCSRVPNSIREALLKRGLVAVARVLDGLLVAGWKPGRIFTEREACVALTVCKIGRRTVMNALKAVLDDQAIFAANPPGTPRIPAHAATPPESCVNSCEMSTGAKRVKSLGRPAQHYQVPMFTRLAERLGVRLTGGDPLAADDLHSPSRYRLALHRAFIARRPGQYTRAWIGARLEVSRWTTRRYEAKANIPVQPVYETRALGWAEARVLPDRQVMTGSFLEDMQGKRYPPVRGLALKLLGQGELLALKRRLPNHFGVPESVPVGIPTRANASAAKVVEKERFFPWPHAQPTSIPTASIPVDSAKSVIPIEGRVGIPTDSTLWYCEHCLDTAYCTTLPPDCRCGDCAWEVIPSFIRSNPESLARWWQQIVAEQQSRPAQRPPASEHQRLIEQARAQVPTLSHKTLRNLIQEYGAKLLEQALSVIRQRTWLRNPAGFLISFIRSSSGKPASQRPKPDQPTENWVEAMAGSEFLNFLANPEDVLQAHERMTAVLI
jgi:hypothetical protein